MKKITLLKSKDIKKNLKTVPLWNVSKSETSLYRTFSFDNHIDALVFIARITVHAQVLNHHPDVLFTFEKVKVTTITHEVKGLTKMDFDLAKKIDSIQTGV